MCMSYGLLVSVESTLLWFIIYGLPGWVSFLSLIYCAVVRFMRSQRRGLLVNSVYKKLKQVDVEENQLRAVKAEAAAKESEKRASAKKKEEAKAKAAVAEAVEARAKLTALVVAASESTLVENGPAAPFIPLSSYIVASTYICSQAEYVAKAASEDAANAQKAALQALAAVEVAKKRLDFRSAERLKLTARLIIVCCMFALPWFPALQLIYILWPYAKMHWSSKGCLKFDDRGFPTELRRQRLQDLRKQMLSATALSGLVFPPWLLAFTMLERAEFRLCASSRVRTRSKSRFVIPRLSDSDLVFRISSGCGVSCYGRVRYGRA